MRGSRSRDTANPSSNCGRDASGPVDGPGYDYLRDPAAIYRRSFALVREAADLGRFPAALRPLAVRLAHAAGDVSILDDLAWSRGAVAHRAPSAGRRRPDPRRQHDGRVRHHAKRGCRPATRSSAPCAIPLSRPWPRNCARRAAPPPSNCGARISPARSSRSATPRPRCSTCSRSSPPEPTAPALVLGFPVGFVGAAEAKEALIGFGRGLAVCRVARTARRQRAGGGGGQRAVRPGRAA